MAIEKSPTALRTIGEVAEELDIATHVLRFWESKFHQIKPQKRRGRRYYRPEDINTLSQIKILLYGEGYTIRGVQKFLAGGGKKKAEGSNNNSPKVASAEQARPAAKQVSKPKPNVESDWFGRDLFGNEIAAEETESEETVTLEEIVGDVPPVNSNVRVVQAAPVIVNKLSESDLNQLKTAHAGLLKIQESLFDLL